MNMLYFVGEKFGLRRFLGHLSLLLGLLALGAGPAFSVSIQPGWPQQQAWAVCESPALGDLDGDGDLEVVIGDWGGKVYAWHSDGALVTGWPQERSSWGLGRSPVLGDLDGDGRPEVVTGSADRGLYAWHGDGSPVTGWPQTLGGAGGGAPALGDLDGNGDVEVVVGSYDHNVYAFHHDGSPVTGWPQNTGDVVESSPALGDLDGDGDLEVVVGSSDHNVYAWHHDGSLVEGWPQTAVGLSFGSPALGDLDGDGEPEVVISSGLGAVYAWRADGSPVMGWPKAIGSWGSPSLGDIDGDGGLEVVVGSDQVYAWHGDGSPVTGWPQAAGGRIQTSPAMGDLDGDGDLEVVLGSFDGKVYAWHGDGSPVMGWPQITGDVVDSAPALGDLDGDGDLEVVVGSKDCNLYVWSCDTPSDDSLAWPMFRHDPGHTGTYGPAAVRPGAHFISSPVIGTVPLQVAFTDQSTASPSSWSWDFGDGTTSSQQNPTHTYTSTGHYTVSLSVVTDLGPDTQTRARCITALFPDVLTDHWAWSQVISCVDANIVKGYYDGLYHPEYPVTRDQMAVFLVRALGQEPTGPASPQSWKDAYGYDPAEPTTWAVDFTDVPASGWGDPEGPYWAWFHIQRLYDLGVTQGVTATEYGPTQQVRRDQMAVFLIRALGQECANPCVDATCWPYDPATPATWAHEFADIPATGQDTCHGAHWAWFHIQALYETGVTLGCGDGTSYCPGDSVRRDEMAVFLARAFLEM